MKSLAQTFAGRFSSLLSPWPPVHRDWSRFPVGSVGDVISFPLLMADPAFQPDSEIAEIAAAYSQDAIELAARNFGVSLDESEASICDVEKMLGRLHNDLANARASEKQVMVIAKAFGSYVGEVLRRHHGAE